MRLLLVLFIGVLLSSCGGNEKTNQEALESEGNGVVKSIAPKDVPKEERLENIRELEEQLKASGEQPDPKLARKLMGEYMDFSNFQHYEPETPDFLFRAGELARYIGRPKKAVELYSNLFNGFPEYPKRVETLNLIAFVYDFDLNEKEKARETYAQIIENFPEHKLAEDARARLETIDLSDEELIELFQEKNQELP